MNMNTESQSREMFLRRMAEFNGPIRHISLNNPLVHQIISQYAHGAIITKEEALSQMVVGLAKNWEKQKQDYIDLMKICPPTYQANQP